MGRFSLSVFKKVIFCWVLLFSSLTYPREKDGITLEEKRQCLGKETPLQGAGLRTATIFGIKVYVLAYYASQKASKTSPYLEQRPACFEIHYLRDFDKEDVDKAWDFQFKESSMHSYEHEKQDREQLKQYFGKIKKGATHFFELGIKETLLLENGELKGKILGEDFQKSFLSLWFGKRPPTKKLQKELLK